MSTFKYRVVVVSLLAICVIAIAVFGIANVVLEKSHFDRLGGSLVFCLLILGIANIRAIIIASSFWRCVSIVVFSCLAWLMVAPGIYVQDVPPIENDGVIVHNRIYLYEQPWNVIKAYQHLPEIIDETRDKNCWYTIQMLGCVVIVILSPLSAILAVVLEVLSRRKNDEQANQ